MPHWFPALLLFVFATHGPAFAWRWSRTREARHAATTVTFALLTVAYGLRVFAPQAAWGDLSLWQAVRVVAWASAAVSLSLLGRHAWRTARRRWGKSAVAAPRRADP